MGRKIDRGPTVMFRKLSALLIMLVLDTVGSFAVLYRMMPLGGGYAQALVLLLPVIFVLNLILAGIVSRRWPWLTGIVLLNALLAPCIFFLCFNLLTSA